ncbi:MAG: hypothetical protein JXR91_15040, partial [Deltaproteobacteria bacterium]|nr:hypothetical protein [Deltaproteobacteria bacterium]
MFDYLKRFSAAGIMYFMLLTFAGCADPLELQAPDTSLDSDTGTGSDRGSDSETGLDTDTGSDSETG